MGPEFLVGRHRVRFVVGTSTGARLILLYDGFLMGMTLFVLRYQNTGVRYIGEIPWGTTRRKYPEEPP